MDSNNSSRQFCEKKNHIYLNSIVGQRGLRLGWFGPVTGIEKGRVARPGLTKKPVVKEKMENDVRNG